MHIVTASDHNYVAGVLVLLSSAAKHNSAARFTVLQSGWSKEDQQKLTALSDRCNIYINRIEIDVRSFEKFPILRDDLTPAAYARLLIPELFPCDNKIIYMDSDMMVTGPLAKAWDCDLTDNVLAAVRAVEPDIRHVHAANTSVEMYFNSGFIVFNLELWRAENLAASCFAALEADDCPYLTEDESALNDVASGRVLYLDAGYNFYAINNVWQSPLESPNSIQVLHYCSPAKPWNTWSPFSDMWFDEAASCRELPNVAKFKKPLRKQISDLNRYRKLAFRWLFGRCNSSDEARLLSWKILHEHNNRTSYKNLLSDELPPPNSQRPN